MYGARPEREIYPSEHRVTELYLDSWGEDHKLNMSIVFTELKEIEA